MERLKVNCKGWIERVFDYIDRCGTESLIEKINAKGDIGIKQCENYIISEAQKERRGSAAVIEDAKVYGWAMHYYEEDIKNISAAPAKVEVAAPKAEPEVVTKSTKESTKNTKNENKSNDNDLNGQMSFEDMVNMWGDFT